MHKEQVLQGMVTSDEAPGERATDGTPGEFQDFGAMKREDETVRSEGLKELQ